VVFEAARFFVTSRGLVGAGSQYKPSLADIAPYWESPESFRDVALEELDRLETRARDLIGSGEAGALWTLGGPTGADPPMPAGPRAEISEKVRAAALEDALSQIAERKQLVEEQFKEMHHATTAAFPPLIEVIGGEGK
jgi:hypothetical protein